MLPVIPFPIVTVCLRHCQIMTHIQKSELSFTYSTAMTRLTVTDVVISSNTHTQKHSAATVCTVHQYCAIIPIFQLFIITRFSGMEVVFQLSYNLNTSWNQTMCFVKKEYCCALPQLKCTHHLHGKGLANIVCTVQTVLWQCAGMRSV